MKKILQINLFGNNNYFNNSIISETKSLSHHEMRRLTIYFVSFFLMMTSSIDCFVCFCTFSRAFKDKMMKLHSFKWFGLENGLISWNDITLSCFKKKRPKTGEISADHLSYLSSMLWNTCLKNLTISLSIAFPLSRVSYLKTVQDFIISAIIQRERGIFFQS